MQYCLGVKYTSFVTGNCFSKCASFLEAPSCHNCLGPTCPWGGSTEQLCADTRAGALLNSRGHHSRRQRCQKDPRGRDNRYDEPRLPELKPASHAGSRVWQHELVSGGPSCSRTVSFLSEFPSSSGLMLYQEGGIWATLLWWAPRPWAAVGFWPIPFISLSPWLAATFPGPP